MRSVRSFLFGACVFAAVAAEAGTVSVSFASDIGCGTGSGAAAPDGWTYTGVGESGGWAYLNSVNDSMTSPDYGGAVTSVVVRARCTNAAATRFLKIEGLDASGIVRVAVTGCVETVVSGYEILIPVSAAVRFVRIGIVGSGQTGNWSVSDAVFRYAESTGSETPADVRAENIGSDAFDIAWDPVAGAVDYLVDAWTEMPGASGGTTVFGQSFADVVNASGNARDLTDALDDVTAAPGWRGERVYAPASSMGYVQIGTGKTTGLLATPPLPAFPACMCVLTARHYDYAREGTEAPIEIVSADGTTNALGSIATTAAFAEYALPVPGTAAGRRLVVHSVVNGSSKRLHLASLALVTDYVREAPSTNNVLVAAVTTSCVRRVEGLDSGTPVYFTVRARNGAGVVSAPSAVRSAIPGTEAEENPFIPGEPLALRNLPVVKGCSGFRERVYEETFSVLTSVTERTTWINGSGLMGPGWYAFLEDDPAVTIARNIGKSYISGLYASFSTNSAFAGPSLSIMGSGTSGMEVQLRILNNERKSKITNVSVSYDGIQASYRNPDDRTMTCSWAFGTDENRIGPWTEVPSLAFRTPYTSETDTSEPWPVRTLSASWPVKISPHEILIFRWSVPRLANGPALGLAHLKVRFHLRDMGTMILVR